MTALPVPIQSAVILKGQRAWSRIKSTAAEQRQLWREVGEALAYGRAMYPSNQAFGQWCKDQGFDMDRQDRSDAIWLASLSDGHTTIPQGLSHPSRIRRWFNEQEATKAPSADLDLSDAQPVVVPPVQTVKPVAHKVNKLAAHAAGTGPEAETAQRYLDSQAKRLGMDSETRVDLASKLEPVARLTEIGDGVPF